MAGAPRPYVDAMGDLQARLDAFREDITADAVDGKVTIAQAVRAGEHHLMRAVNELARGVPGPDRYEAHPDMEQVDDFDLAPLLYLPLSEVTDGHVAAFIRARRAMANQGGNYEDSVRAGLAAVQWPAALAAGIEEHIQRDRLSPVKAAVFRDRGGHAPGEQCPSAPAREPIHRMTCLVFTDEDCCTCGALDGREGNR